MLKGSRVQISEHLDALQRGGTGLLGGLVQDRPPGPQGSALAIEPQEGWHEGNREVNMDFLAEVNKERT